MSGITKHKASGAASRCLASTTALIALAGAMAGRAEAAPVASSVSAGNAVVTQSTQPGTYGAKDVTVNISQTSPKSVINWSNFNVLNNAREVDYVVWHPGSHSDILLNIISGPASQINGSMLGGGSMWFVNPNGFSIGKNSNINVFGSALFSTAGLSNPNGSGFYTNSSGLYNFNVAGSPTATIQVNSGYTPGKTGSTGEIVASDSQQTGNIILQAPGIDLQNAWLGANGGTVALAAGRTFVADFNGDNLVNYQVTGPVAEKIPGMSSSITVNNSSIHTAGAVGGVDTPGAVLISAQVEQNAILDHVINMGGDYYDQSGQYVNVPVGDNIITTPLTLDVNNNKTISN